jgi:hypothetical protein
MRKTNKDKYDELALLLDDKKNLYIKQTLGKDKPSKFYCVYPNGIFESNIEKYSVKGKKEPYFFSKKITNVILKQFEDYLEMFDNDEKIIYIHYSSDNNTPFFTVKGMYKFNEILEKPSYSFNKEDLIELQKELSEKYSPKDGYAPCSYCGKQTPIDKLIKKEIITRTFGGIVKKVRDYCSGVCAGYDQMAQGD